LHRQHYPDLPNICRQLFINEEESAARIKESNLDSNNNKVSSASTASASYRSVE
jgi:hypothetical protein